MVCRGFSGTRIIPPREGRLYGTCQRMGDVPKPIAGEVLPDPIIEPFFSLLSQSGGFSPPDFFLPGCDAWDVALLRIPRATAPNTGGCAVGGCGWMRCGAWECSAGAPHTGSVMLCGAGCAPHNEEEAAWVAGVERYCSTPATGRGKSRECGAISLHTAVKARRTAKCGAFVLHMASSASCVEHSCIRVPHGFPYGLVRHIVLRCFTAFRANPRQRHVRHNTPAAYTGNP